MTNLSVNLNKIALLRNSRNNDSPNMLEAARVAINAGADGLTVHPRPDLRHALPEDVRQLSELVNSEYRNIELNVEGNPFTNQSNNGYPGFMAMVLSIRPTQVTLVPDDDHQLTSDHGWELTEKRELDRLRSVIERLRQVGCRVSLFMDADTEKIGQLEHIGAQRIELYTGPFAKAHSLFGGDREETKNIFKEHVKAAVHAESLGLEVNAGHDLDLSNLKLYKTLPGLKEVSIGHALVADALKFGLRAAVLRYKEILGDKS